MYDIPVFIHYAVVGRSRFSQDFCIITRLQGASRFLDLGEYRPPLTGGAFPLALQARGSPYALVCSPSISPFPHLCRRACGVIRFFVFASWRAVTFRFQFAQSLSVVIHLGSEDFLVGYLYLRFSFGWFAFYLRIFRPCKIYSWRDANLQSIICISGIFPRLWLVSASLGDLLNAKVIWNVGVVKCYQSFTFMAPAVGYSLRDPCLPSRFSKSLNVYFHLMIFNPHEIYFCVSYLVGTQFCFSIPGLGSLRWGSFEGFGTGWGGLSCHTTERDTSGHDLLWIQEEINLHSGDSRPRGDAGMKRLRRQGT